MRNMPEVEPRPAAQCEMAAFILSHLQNLGTLAKAEGLDMLAHFIRMAAIEAQSALPPPAETIGAPLSSDAPPSWLDPGLEERLSPWEGSPAEVGACQ